MTATNSKVRKKESGTASPKTSTAVTFTTLVLTAVDSDSRRRSEPSTVALTTSGRSTATRYETAPSSSPKKSERSYVCGPVTSGIARARYGLALSATT